MRAQFILDTGPLVAWLCPRDQHHAWEDRAFAQLPAGGMVCEAVLAEACHLAAQDGIPGSKVIEFVERGHIMRDSPSFAVSLWDSRDVIRTLGSVC